MINGDLLSKLQQAASYLNNNGRATEATELEDLARKLQGSNITKQEFEGIKKRIISRCDIRWLGDIHIKEMESPYEWWNLLGSIKSLAGKI